MKDRTSITVDESTLERFNDEKGAFGADDMPNASADRFVNSLLDTLEAVESGHYDDLPDGLLVMRDADPETLEAIRESVENTEDRTDKIKWMLEELTGRHD